MKQLLRCFLCSHVQDELTFGESSLFEAGKILEEAICITVFSSGACWWMLSCLLSWMVGEWADHTYSLTLTETFIALYVNKGFQCTVGQRLKSTMGAPLLNSHSQASGVQRTYWKQGAQYWFKHGSVSTLILELKHNLGFPENFWTLVLVDA